MDLKIIEELKDLIQPSASVHAMWLGGSIAEGTSDEYSDVDVWVDLEDGKEKEIITIIETFLSGKGTIDINFSEGITPPFTHIVYRLSHMKPYHFIEINLHSHSHKFELFDRLRKIQVLFDKDDTTSFEPLNEEEYRTMLAERKDFLLEKIKIGEISVQKELLRNNFTDAMHNYLFWLVEPVIELARIQLSPLKITYNLKHASRDLPKETVAEIESLYKVSSLESLNDKITEIRLMAKKYS